MPVDADTDTRDLPTGLGATADQSAAPRVEQEPVSPLDRRSLLKHGLAVTALPVLGLDDAEFVPARLTLSPPQPTFWAAPIFDAVINPLGATRRVRSAPDTKPVSRPDDESMLRECVDNATSVSLSAGYADLARLLPDLIGCAESANAQAQGDERPAVLCVLSDVYAVAGWTLIKADHSLGAWLAAQRAVQAAQEADDALRLAAATRCLAEVHMRAHNFEEATRMAFLAAIHLDAAPPADRRAALCLRGAALLSASAAAARRGDSHEAYASLKVATTCARELDEERSDLGTVFGPTNVCIHRVAVAVELGDAHEAARHIPTVDLDRMPASLTERRARFLIDAARSHAQLKDDSTALYALLQAERFAPAELRQHRLTRKLVPQLLSRERGTPELRALADRCGLLQ